MKTIVNQYQKMRRNENCPCVKNSERERPLRFKKCCGIKLATKEQDGITKINAMKKIKKLKNEAIARHQHKLDHPLILPDNMVGGENKPKIITN